MRYYTTTLSISGPSGYAGRGKICCRRGVEAQRDNNDLPTKIYKGISHGIIPYKEIKGYFHRGGKARCQQQAVTIFDR
jgi:hypothetical protein